MAVALPVEQTKVDQGTKDRDIEGPDVCLDPKYSLWRLRDSTTDNAGCENLTEKDGVHFANEGISDFGRGI